MTDDAANRTKENCPGKDEATAQFIAGIVGPIFLVIGLSMLLQREIYANLAHQLAQSTPFMILSRILSLAAGLAIIRTHNVWKGWQTVVSTIGWLLVIGGAIRLMFPQALSIYAARVGPAPYLPVRAMVVLAFGSFLTYKSLKKRSSK